LFGKLLGYHRHFGDTIIPCLADTPGLARTDRIATHAEGLATARQLLPDASDARSARLELNHDTNPGFQYGLAEPRHFNGAVDDVFAVNRALTHRSVAAAADDPRSA